MTELKCPYCNKTLQHAITVDGHDFFWCENYDCDSSTEMVGTIEMWASLIDMKKTLDESEHCCTEWEKQALDYKAENIKLSTALDVAVDALNGVCKDLPWIKRALDKIKEIKGE